MSTSYDDEVRLDKATIMCPENQVDHGDDRFDHFGEVVFEEAVHVIDRMLKDGDVDKDEVERLNIYMNLNWVFIKAEAKGALREILSARLKDQVRSFSKSRKKRIKSATKHYEKFVDSLFNLGKKDFQTGVVKTKDIESLFGDLGRRMYNAGWDRDHAVLTKEQ